MALVKKITLKQQVEETGLSKQVIFTGIVDDIELSCLYEIRDIFVMPHRQVETTLDTEGCPTVFLEAGALGIIAYCAIAYIFDRYLNYGIYGLIGERVAVLM